jgi:hypothetical protein
MRRIDRIAISLISNAAHRRAPTMHRIGFVAVRRPSM